MELFELLELLKLSELSKFYGLTNHIQQPQPTTKNSNQQPTTHTVPHRQSWKSRVNFKTNFQGRQVYGFASQIHCPKFKMMPFLPVICVVFLVILQIGYLGQIVEKYTISQNTENFVF